MKKIPFLKMSGSGNDFIIIDNREGSLSEYNMYNINDLVRSVCRRRFSVGADGFILIEYSKKAHFKWHFYNADGSEVGMCGNGARCAARFAYLKGIAGNAIIMETKVGIIKAQVNGTQVKIEMCTPEGVLLDYNLPIGEKKYLVSHINTGVPHVVMFVENLEDLDVVGLGGAIRFHEKYKPHGCNANFVKTLENQELAIRTYERGVEDETLSCGTGAVAAALISHLKGLVKAPVEVHTKGGEALMVHFRNKGSRFTDVFLEGRAKVIYGGELWDEALQ